MAVVIINDDDDTSCNLMCLSRQQSMGARSSYRKRPSSSFQQLGGTQYSSLHIPCFDRKDFQ